MLDIVAGSTEMPETVDGMRLIDSGATLSPDRPTLGLFSLGANFRRASTRRSRYSKETPLEGWDLNLAHALTHSQASSPGTNTL